uniref:Uncharacterized protein n=1 Tax=Chromera velia CCMP2878 TaxID=1169474 RepID=A0A0G4I2B0_9ALVE|eukprot:Cvel_35023.t1-p1 / transcript=Cvel_35023.t1 / gene=Cvel_35023 / organism=Chromera_velia_CCMP2878 / gene_product=hypothetical protein / transcript_product=hypothetical protein / location=Cvel_scaffold6229:240-545(+) / protein_length=102 / sequence_SO=supercontig / SO=protein_coding / is_pseudo=false
MKRRALLRQWHKAVSKYEESFGDQMRETMRPEDDMAGMYIKLAPCGNALKEALDLFVFVLEDVCWECSEFEANDEHTEECMVFMDARTEGHVARMAAMAIEA